MSNSDNSITETESRLNPFALEPLRSQKDDDETSGMEGDEDSGRIRNNNW